MPVIAPTSAFIDAMRYGAVLIQARITVLSAGVAVGSPYYAAVSTGTFTTDRNSEFRRSGQITLEFIPPQQNADGTWQLPPPLEPVNPTSLTAPFGNELFIETGVLASTSSAGVEAVAQWVPNGLFVIATTTLDDTTIDCTAQLDVYDRAWTIAQRTLKNPYNFPAVGGNFAAEMKALLNQVWNQQAGVQPLQFNIVPTSEVVPTASYDQGSDPWQATQDMAAAIGYELYFDTAGIVCGKPIPNALTAPITWGFTDDTTLVQGLAGTGSTALLGSPYSTPVEASVIMTRDGIFNDIIIQGTGDANAGTYTGDGLETTGPPILGEAADNNPLSPTYIGGGLGDVPDFVSSSLVTAIGAQAMANTQLQVALSTSWQATISAPPNPIFDVDDVIVIDRPRVGLYKAKLVLDTITNTFQYDDLTQLTGRILTNGSVAGG